MDTLISGYYSLINLEEAEYVVSMYQYLRLLGHPGRSIVILTTYEEQSNLIKDIMNLRCVDSPHFGKPNDVTVSLYLNIYIYFIS